VVGVLIREEACIVLALVGATFVFVGAFRARPAPSGLLLGAPLESRRLIAAGIGLGVLSLGALWVYFGAVIPRVGAWQPSRFYDYPFAQGPAQLVAALVTHPAYLGQLLAGGRLTYVLEALGPLAFLPLRSWWSVLAVPGLLGLLLSSDQIAWRMGSHYAAIWIPWLLLGALAALVAFERRGARRTAQRWWVVALTACGLVLLAFDPAHPAHYLRAVYADTADAERALRRVPKNAHLATHDEWFVRVALTHPSATVFFCPYVDWAVYADDYPNAFFQAQIRPQLQRELSTRQTRVVARFGKVGLYERTPDPQARVGECITPGDLRYRAHPP